MFSRSDAIPEPCPECGGARYWSAGGNPPTDWWVCASCGNKEEQRKRREISGVVLTGETILLVIDGRPEQFDIKESVTIALLRGVADKAAKILSSTTEKV